ncbi:MAG: phosphohistidine phosphatase SixA [Ignavibacteriae bacterium]|nr:phosphohistidine phosphatase SixA [Ignavibacteriota bacterium]
MEIYIVRHAVAVPRGTEGYPNDDRPLTEEGIQKMKATARGIAEIIGKVDVIISSPLIRAHDTAKIVAKALKYKSKIDLSKEFLPGNSQNSVLDFLVKFKNKKNIMLVGHEPDVGVLASTLLGSNRPLIAMKKGAVCRIDVAELPLKEPGKLIWHLTPKQLRALA